MDMESGRLTTLVDLNPEMRSIRFSDVERLEWTNEAGQPSHAYLVKPLAYEQGKRYPLVILTYRALGFLDDATYREYPAHVLAAKGFMVLVFHRSFERMWTYGVKGQYDNNAQDRRDVEESLERGIGILEQTGLIDPARIAVTGLSDGTAITYWALTHSKRRFAAAIVSSAAPEPIEYYLTSPFFRQWMREEMGIDFSKDGAGKRFYQVFAPSQNAERIQAPLLLNLPDAEVLLTMQTITTLRELNKPFEAYVFPNEYHEKWQPVHRYNIYRRNVQWLQFWLQDREVDDPVDPMQYGRWRELRARQQRGLSGVAALRE